MATTTLPARTVSQQAWAKASHTTPSLPSEVDSAVNGIMAELSQLHIPASVRVVSCAPWVRSSEHCSGSMWASVPRIAGSWRDGDGWIISTRGDRTALSSCFLRISPAPEGEDRIQYGFCPIRLNTLPEMKQQQWGTDPLRMSSLVIQTAMDSSFRTDKMVMSAIRLFNPVSSSPESERFMELLGRRSMSVFVEDMLRGCYADSSSARDILRGRDDRYKEMMGLIAGHAYRAWDNPITETELSRFRNAMGVTSQDRWCPDCVWPYLYNVVMPRSIFEANSRNLEAGIPPVIPHYTTPRHWMFNGSWSSPCTGLVFSQRCGIDKLGEKMTAGLLGKSNLDLPGAVSVWPTTDNPPQEWLEKFVGCIEDIGHLEMPLDIGDRIDLVLHESHRIPVVFRIHTTGSASVDRTYKFVRMIRVGYHTTNLDLRSLTVRECSPGGDEWRGEEIGVGENPSTAVTVASADDGGEHEYNEEDYSDCADCGNNRHDEDLTMCVECDGAFCDSCIRGCPGCDDWSCADCRYTVNDEGSEVCSSCGRERLEGV